MPTAHLNGSLADAILLRRVYLMSLYHRFRWNILINECQVIQIYAADNVITLNIEGVSLHAFADANANRFCNNIVRVTQQSLV